VEYSRDFLKVKEKLIYFKHLSAKIECLKKARDDQEFHLKRSRDIFSGIKSMEKKIQEKERFILALEKELKLVIPKAKKLGKGFHPQ
jgi:hypothetical protein